MMSTSGGIAWTCSITCAALVARATEKPFGARMVSRDQIQISWSFATRARGGRACTCAPAEAALRSCWSATGGLGCTTLSVYRRYERSRSAARFCKTRAETRPSGGDTAISNPCNWLHDPPEPAAGYGRGQIFVISMGSCNGSAGAPQFSR